MPGWQIGLKCLTLMGQLEKRFKSARQAQRFLSAQGLIYGHFRPRRHRMAASAYRVACAGAFRVWREETYDRRAI